MNRTELLNAALIGFRQQMEQISAKISEIEMELRGAAPVAVPAKGRKMSAAGRAKIAQAQRARWQKFHKEQGKAA